MFISTLFLHIGTCPPPSVPLPPPPFPATADRGMTRVMAAADEDDYFVDEEDAIKFITFPEEVEKAIEQVRLKRNKSPCDSSSCVQFTRKQCSPITSLCH